jgi:hypothetical protein
MTISYVITCDIGINSIHKYIYHDGGNGNIVFAMFCCVTVLYCLYCVTVLYCLYCVSVLYCLYCVTVLYCLYCL